ncbi:hypothetical protein H5410_003225, partial [Solanum commersonii]
RGKNRTAPSRWVELAIGVFGWFAKSPRSPFISLFCGFECCNFWRHVCARRKYLLISLLRPFSLKLICNFWRATSSSPKSVNDPLMARPKVAGRDMPPRKKAHRVLINKEAVASKENVTKLPPKVGKGKDEAP